MLRLIILIIFCTNAITCAQNRDPETNSGFDNRIVRGVSARRGQFPWQAALKISTSRGTSLCGGVLISPIWVLTAAHCLFYDTSKINVTLGAIFLNNSTTGTTIPASKYLRHPNSFLTVNDIGLVKLAQSVQFSTFISPIKLSPTPIKSGVQVTVSGWGKTHHDNAGVSQILNFANLVTISNLECFLTYPFLLLLNYDYTVCAQGQAKESTCLGDSGGPLISGSGNVLVGIVSFGSEECARGRSVGFTRVEPFKTWIVSITGPLD